MRRKTFPCSWTHFERKPMTSPAEFAAPRWDLTPIFPSLESPEFEAAFTGAVAEIDALAALFDAKGVRRRADPVVDAAFAAAYDEVTNRLNALNERMRTLWSY